MMFIAVAVLGLFLFMAATRPDGYYVEMRRYKKDFPEVYEKKMQNSFSQRYWNSWVLANDSPVSDRKNAPYIVTIVFVYIFIALGLEALATSAGLRSLSGDDEIQYLFGVLIVYVAGMISYPLFKFAGFKMGYEDTPPDKRYRRRSPIFFLVYVFSVLAFFLMQEADMSYRLSEILASIPLILYGGWCGVEELSNRHS